MKRTSEKEGKSGRWLSVAREHETAVVANALASSDAMQHALTKQCKPRPAVHHTFTEVSMFRSIVLDEGSSAAASTRLS